MADKVLIIMPGEHYMKTGEVVGSLPHNSYKVKLRTGRIVEVNGRWLRKAK